MKAIQIEQRINWLDGWRAIAVAIVILSHVSGVYNWRFELPGKLGVYIFFSISGYIVTRLLLKERAASGRIDISGFYLRRAARILPPLVIFIAACLLLGRGGMDGALRSATFTCNVAIGPGDCGWIFGHTWSLAFEEQYYLLLPLFLAGRRRWLFALTIPLALAPFIFPLNFIGRIGFLQIYMLLGLGAAVAANEKRAFGLLTKVPSWVSIALLALSGAWIILPPGLIQMLTGTLVPFAVVVSVFALPMRSQIARLILASVPMRTVGLWSYTLYLWQQLALTTPPPVPVVIGLSLAMGLAALSHSTIEKWMRDWAKQRHYNRSDAQGKGVPSTSGNRKEALPHARGDQPRKC